MAADEIKAKEIPSAGQAGEGGDIDWILENCKRIALCGASPKADRPSHRIMRFLLEKGYEVIPIRPGVEEILSQRCYPSVRAVSGGIDLALIFRRAEDAPPIVEEAIGRGVKAIWMQEGIVSHEAFQRATAGGLRAVMDRCIYKELMAREE